MTNESAMTSTSVCDEIHPVRSLVENDRCLTAEIKPGAAVKSYQKYTWVNIRHVEYQNMAPENIQRKVRNRTAENREYILMIWRRVSRCSTIGDSDALAHLCKLWKWFLWMAHVGTFSFMKMNSSTFIVSLFRLKDNTV